MTMENKIVAVLSEKALDEVKKLGENKAYELEYGFVNLKGIKHPIAYIKGAWCLNTIGKELPEGFKFTDIDGFLNYYGRSLFLEFKKSPNCLIGKEKQYKALCQFVKSTETTVFMAFGEPCEPTHYLVIDKDHPFGTDLIKTNLSDFQNVLAEWCKNNQPSSMDIFDDAVMSWKVDVKIANLQYQYCCQTTEE